MPWSGEKVPEPGRGVNRPPLRLAIPMAGGSSVMGMEFTPRRRLELVSGRSHPELARDVAAQLGVTLGEANLREFANGEIHCRFDTSIRGVTSSSSRPTADRSTTP